MTHPKTGHERCSHCRAWSEQSGLPIRAALPRAIAGGTMMLKFCNNGCAFGWALERGLVPIDLLPPPVITHIAHHARRHVVTKITRQGQRWRQRRGQDHESDGDAGRWQHAHMDG